MEETAVIYQIPGSMFRNLFFFRNKQQRDIFIDSPTTFVQYNNSVYQANSELGSNSSSIVFPPLNEIPERIDMSNASQILTKEKNLANYCPVTLYEEEKVVKGYQLYLAYYKDSKFIFDTPQKLIRFTSNPVRYAKVSLPVKMPPINEKITLLSFTENDDAIAFLEQSVGAIATRALLEITSCRMKYPTLSVKETALKLFAMFLKANNPSNTEYTKKKYQKKIRTFVDRCELPHTIYKLKKKKGKLCF